MEEKRLNNSNKHHLVGTVGFRIMGFFFVITLLVIVIFEIFYLQSINQYYYDNMASVLHNQARYNADLYLTYFSDTDLMDVIVENKNQFYRSNDSQVQIVSNDGTVLYDGIGTDLVGEQLSTADVLAAQDNRYKVYIGNVPYDTQKVMSVSYPLRNQSQQVGFIRLTTSLQSVDRIVMDRAATSIIFSLAALTISVILSYLLSRSIINPISDLTKVANKLADGQFNIKAEDEYFGELGGLAKTLNFMSENIVKKDALKNEFISSVSHELRTPLTSIKGWAITLQSDGVDEEINREGLKIIEKESERLSAMVEDLLDFSRFSAGRITLSKDQFDLVDVTQRIITQFRPHTREKHIDMVFNFNEDVILLTADEDKIKQLLLNVIDNAIKFTGEGGTIITDLSDEGDEIKIAVTDTGIGISEDEISLVTEKFWKGSSSASHSGLGLSICEEIAKAHGGSLNIRSKVDVGTTVSVALPKESV